MWIWCRGRKESWPEIINERPDLPRLQFVPHSEGLGRLSNVEKNLEWQSIFVILALDSQDPEYHLVVIKIPVRVYRENLIGKPLMHDMRSDVLIEEHQQAFGLIHIAAPLRPSAVQLVQCHHFPTWVQVLPPILRLLSNVRSETQRLEIVFQITFQSLVVERPQLLFRTMHLCRRCLFRIRRVWLR